MTPVTRRTAPDRAPRPIAIALLVGVLVAACGVATGSATPSVPASASPAASTVAPPAGGSGSPDATDGSAVGPSPTPWPGGVVEAVVILGKADLEIKAAGADLGAAAADEDLQAMWGAADGLATLIERLEPQVDRIRDYPVTASAAAAYDAAFPDMLAGAKGIRDAITAGDGAALTAAVTQLSKGTAAYEAARREIGPLVEPALLMQRILVK